MAKKVFNMAGGSHSAAALSAFLSAAFAGKVASGLKVVETGVTGLNVIVQPGTGQIDTGQGFSRVFQIDSDETIALSPASPSNPRRDLIVAYIDNGVTPTTSVVDNINDVLKIAAVAGAPAGSPVDPSGSAIQAAIGAGNPYIILARVRVAQSATSLSNSVIDDMREMALITRSDQLSSGIIEPEHLDDTGWIQLNTVISYRKKGSIVQVKGVSSDHVQIGGGSYINVGTLPYDYRPDQAVQFMFSTVAGDLNFQAANLTTDGNLNMYLPAGKTTKYWTFNFCFIV